MKKKVSLIKLIRNRSMVFLFLIALSFAIFNIILTYSNFKTQSEELKKQYITQQKNIVKQEVMRVVQRINEVETENKLLIDKITKNRTDEAYAIIDNIYQQNKATKTKNEIKNILVDALAPISFHNAQGYFFLVQLDSKALLYPANKKLEGKNLLHSQNNIKDITKEMLNIIDNYGEGFYEYSLDNSGEGIKQSKKTYIKLYKPLNIYIGSELDSKKMQTIFRNKLLSDISKIRYRDDGYIFINHWNGDALVSNGHLVNGQKKLWELFDKNPQRTKNLFNKEYDAAIKSDGDFIYYTFQKLQNSKKEFPKTSFIYGLPDLQWLIGAGIYLDNIEEEIANLQTRFIKRSSLGFIFLGIITILVLLIFAIFFKIQSRKIIYDYKLFLTFFKEAVISNKKLDRRKLSFKEFDLLAKNANKMLHEKILIREQLYKEKDELSVTLHSIGDGVITTNLKGQITMMNKVAEDLTGWLFKQAKGKQIIEVFKVINTQTGNPIKSSVSKVLSEGKIVGLSNHTKLISKYGIEYQISDSAAPIKGKKGSIKGVIIVFHDITKEHKMRDNLEKSKIALKKSEFNLRSIFNAMTDIVMELDANGYYLDVAPTSPDLMYKPVTKLLGKKIEEVFEEELAARFLIGIKKSLKEKSTEKLEYQLTINNKNIWFECRIIPKTINSVLLIAHDISERKVAEARKERDLQEKNTLLKELYHRTKNNMQVISSMLKMQSMQTKDPYILETFKGINNKISSMSLVHKKLYQSQDLSYIDLKEYIEELVELLAQSFHLDSEQISFNLNLNKVNVLLDSAVPLGLVINELITNMFKHAFPDHRKGEITISLSRNTEAIILIIADNGVGIDKNINPLKSKSMGLRTVKNIVTIQLKGEISYNSDIGLEYKISLKDDQHKQRV